MTSRVIGAFLRALVVGALIVLPSLGVSGASPDSSFLTGVAASVLAGLVAIEYSSSTPNLIAFRQIYLFNRLRVGGFAMCLACTSALLSIDGLWGVFWFVPWVVGGMFDFALSPVTMLIGVLAPGVHPETLDRLHNTASLAYLLSFAAPVALGVVLHRRARPTTGGPFNIYLNLPTFDPSRCRDVVEHLERKARVNIVLGLVFPFLAPQGVNAISFVIGPASSLSPLSLIWIVTLWAFFSSSLLMRGIAAAHIAKMINDLRKKRYTELGDTSGSAFI